MSGCFPNSDPCRCKCHTENWNGTECCKCHSSKFYHPDGDNNCHKSHQLSLKRIDELESQVKSLTEMYKHLSISIAGYQDHKNRQIDENRKISRRVDEILEICIRQLTDRIEKLESPDNDEPHHVLKMHERIDFILNKLNAVEKLISNWEEEFYFLKAKLRSPDSKPHKCPVCDGKGSFKKEVEPRVLSFEVCTSCGGKGIVWS